MTNLETLLLAMLGNKGGGGEGGTTNYNELDNRPQVNGITLTGNKDSEDLNLVDVDMIGVSYGVAALDENGKVPQSQLPTPVAQKEYKLTEITSESYAKSYKLQVKNGETWTDVSESASINIPKDMVVESGSVKTCTEADTPVQGYEVGDKYIDLVIANKVDAHIYISVKDLIDNKAEGIQYSNTTSKLTSTNVQEAVDEIVATKADKTEISSVENRLNTRIDVALGDMVKAPQVAEVGQILAVKAVDDEGKPTEWKTVDGGGDGFNYPDEIAMPGDQLYVKEVGSDGKPTKWTYNTLEGFTVYDTNSKTEYTSYTGSLNGYNFLNANGDVEHTIYRIDNSNLSIDGENQLFGINESMTIVSSKDKKNYIVIKRIDNDTVVAYNYVNKELAKTDTLLVFEKKPITIYGFHINSNESNPSNAVTYLEEAIGFTPAFMNYSTDTFNYGSWEDAFFMPRPCMLKSDGTVAYYLNPNDYSKKEDGSASDITNTSFDGNAMMEWGKDGKQIWVKKVADANNVNSVSVYIADGQADEDYHAWSFIDKNGTLKEHFYTPIYQGSLISNKLRSLSTQNLMESTTAEQEISYATANGSGWNTEVWCDIELIQDLLVLMSKTLDTQTAFGMGNCNGYNYNNSTLNSGFEYHYGMLKPGSMNTKGLFWGKNSSVNTNGQRTGVKVFGMENLWANQWRRYAGMINDYGAIKIKKCYGISDGSTTATYNTTGSGYINTGVTLSTGGYLNKMNYSVGSNIPSAVSGSGTTYYCDYTYANSSQVNYAFFGGNCYIGVGAGAFCFNLNNAASVADWNLGAALSFK